jgi:methionyl-tRNA formyltransferase
VPSLAALCREFSVAGVVTQPDKPRGRWRKSRPTEVKAFALEAGLPVIEPEDVAAPEPVARIEQWEPDVMVVAAYGRILPRRLLDLPRMGCVNLHASLLPRHRGASPISAAILAGDRVTGVTTIMMDEEMDTGDILLAEEIPIRDETAGELHDQLMELGARIVVHTLKGLADRSITPRPQDHSAATYCRTLSKKDGRMVWEKEAPFLSRLVRAMNPWPTAYCRLGGDIIKVWRGVPADGEAEPGGVAGEGPEGSAGGTGRGLLVLEEVQAPGKRRVCAADFARGRRLKAGDRFEDGL